MMRFSLVPLYHDHHRVSSMALKDDDPNYALYCAVKDLTTAALWLALAIRERPELADALGIELEQLRAIEAAVEQEMT